MGLQSIQTMILVSLFFLIRGERSEFYPFWVCFCYNPIAFVQIPVVGVPDKKGKKWTYSYKELNVPTDGRYVALYMMAFWNNETAGQQAYTTQTMVLPDTMPFKDCVKKGDCPITLV